MKAIVEWRSQHRKGTWPRQGPDYYCAVQVVPKGVQPLKVLRHDHARKRGIEIIYVGEAYGEFQGPRSRWKSVDDEAKEIAEEYRKMVLPRTTLLQKEILIGLAKNYAVHPTEYGSSDLERAISGNWLDSMNTSVKAKTVYSLEEKRLIEIDYYYELGRCYPQVGITDLGRAVATQYFHQITKTRERAK